MPVATLEFFHTEKGIGDEQWFYLGRDLESGDVFVLHETSLRHRDGYKQDRSHIELDAFLKHKGTAQDKLRALIGSLVKDQANATRS